MFRYRTPSAQPKPKKIKLKGKAYTRLKKKVWQSQLGQCAHCKKFVSFEESHLHHKQTRGAGGSDTEANTEILCWQCHAIWHGPKFKWLK